ncbi:MAG TPA: hypothetical protein DCG57_18760 [Candidatus Riflebacteria bacterium]|nr:hypothetical protein [Candidatus Riflebacteria bacterium]
MHNFFLLKLFFAVLYLYISTDAQVQYGIVNHMAADQLKELSANLPNQYLKPVFTSLSSLLVSFGNANKDDLIQAIFLI